MRHSKTLAILELSHIFKLWVWNLFFFHFLMNVAQYLINDALYDHHVCSLL